MIKTYDIEQWLKAINASPEQILWELLNSECSLDDFRSQVVRHAAQADPQEAELHALMFEAPPYEREAFSEEV